MTMLSTPFPLGAYIGTPDGSSVSATATFEANYGSFVATMGIAPQFLDTYVDYTQPVSNWVNDASFAAWSAAITPDAQDSTPVIGLPMYSTAAGALTPDQQYQAIIAGQDDSVLAGIVKSYTAEGFTNLVFRPGWEMNLQGPTFAGSTTQDQADWVAAFQHIYTALHADAAADGATATVVWNPGTTNYSNVSATAALYPGGSYVDAIGADVYSDVYPYNDGGSSITYHDWATGGEDTTVAQFVSNPINRVHYWSYPAANEWSLNASGGHSLSLNDITQFAEQQDKPLAIPETGAGNSNNGTDVQDDPAFPQWLSQQLTAAKATGEKIDFVNIWDSNASGGNYEFSYAADGKPLEAASWATYFGGQRSAPITVTAVAAVALTDNITSEPFAGLTITDPNAVQTETAVATLNSNANGVLSDPNAPADGGTFSNGSYTITGTIAAVAAAMNGLVFTPTPHQVVVGQIVATTITATVSDAEGATAFVTSTVTTTAVAPVVVPTTIGTGNDTVALKVSEDAYLGNAQFTISVDGVQVGGVQTVTATHANSQDQTFDVMGDWGAGTHTVTADFLNDLYAGTTQTDRNLYVDGASYDGTAAVGSLALMSGGSQSVTVGTPAPATTTIGTGNDTVALKVSEDAYLGNAQFTISVDGVQVGGVQTATATHANSQDQTFDVMGDWGAGTHTVTADFLNDLYAGTTQTDRNLYVDGASYDGTAAVGSLALMSGGSQSVTVETPSPAITTIGTGNDTVALKVSEDAYLGNAQFTISVDGVQVGGVQTATATHANSQDQTFDVMGDWGASTHTVTADFLNDLYAGTTQTDRNLYVDGASYDGTAAVGSLALMSGGSQSVTVGTPAPATTTIGTGNDTVALKVSEDAYLGNAQFTISVDGVQVGGVQTATATHANSQDQTFDVMGDWGAGTHTVTADFLNDLYAGTTQTDRNLYVDGASYDGTVQPGGSLALFSSGSQSFAAVSSTTFAEGAAGGKITTLGNDTVTIGSGAVQINAEGPSVHVTGGSAAMTFIAHGGVDTVTAGSGATTVSGSTGSLIFNDGIGNSNVTLGSGLAIFTFINGAAGGALTINDFIPGIDQLHLKGYSGTGVASEQVTAGSTIVVLTDSTKITLSGVASPSSHPLFT